MTVGQLALARGPIVDPAVVRRVVVFRALHLGDFLCSVPALRALDQLYPRAEITLVGLPWLRSIISRFPYVDRFLEFPGYWGLEGVPWRADLTRAFLEEATLYRYDLAVQMHGNGRISNGFVSRLGARTSVGYRRDSMSRSTKLDLGLPYPDGVHEVFRCLRLIEVLGGEPNPDLEFPLRPEDDQEADSLLSIDGVDPKDRLVIVHPGASSAEKRWPAASFAQAADCAASRLEAQVLVTGSASEMDIAQSVAVQMKHRAVVVAGHTSLGALAALISRASLLLTNDSGPSHLAVAARTPSVVVFGPTDPDRWAPLDREHHRIVCAEPGALISSIPTQRVVNESMELTG